MKKIRFLVLLVFAGLTFSSVAMGPPVMRPPSFVGGVPGMAQMQSIILQRHQARTLLYREALEELHNNPAAADVPECPPGAPPESFCLRRPEAATATPREKVAVATPPPVTKAETPAPEEEEAPPPKAKPKALQAKSAASRPTAPKEKPQAAARADSQDPEAQEEAVRPEAKIETPKPTVHEEIASTEARIETPKPTAPEESSSPQTQAEAATTKKTRHYRALLFGDNAYKAPIPALDTPIGDVDGIAEILQANLGYEPRVVHDASKAKIIEEINKIAAETKPEDSVLLLYAGHGYLDDTTKTGYWIPVDASASSAKGWVSNNDVAKLLSAIPAYQLILVSDSCFSGSLTREEKVTSKTTENIEDIINHRSVLAFSSGDEEPVSDEGKENHSIFAWNLIQALKKITATTHGYDIYQIVYTGVKASYPQSPQYGAVLTAGHKEGGDYLFAKHDQTP